GMEVRAGPALVVELVVVEPLVGRVEEAERVGAVLRVHGPADAHRDPVVAEHRGEARRLGLRARSRPDPRQHGELVAADARTEPGHVHSVGSDRLGGLTPTGDCAGRLPLAQPSARAAASAARRRCPTFSPSRSSLQTRYVTKSATAGSTQTRTRYAQICAVYG